MATSPQSIKASDDPCEASASLDQPNAQSSPESPPKKGFLILFNEACEMLDKMTDEERREKYPFLKRYTAGAVSHDRAMEFLEELEREDALAASAELDETEATGADGEDSRMSVQTIAAAQATE